MSDFQLPPITIHERHAAGVLSQADPYWTSDYGIREVHEKGVTGQNVRVGIIDTGIDELHSKQDGQLHHAMVKAKDFTNSRHGYWDTHGHGTHVAGVVAAQNHSIANGVGLYIAKGLGDDGSGSNYSIANAINWLVDEEVDVINMSLGSSRRSRIIGEAIERAALKGIITLAAAGNDSGVIGWPAMENSAFSVGAINKNKDLAGFSNFGPNLDGVSPGVRIRSLYSNGGYAVLSGTSMATPWMTGMVALRIEAERQAEVQIVDTVHALRSHLQVTAEDLGPAGRDPRYGYGVPDTNRFLHTEEPSEEIPDEDKDENRQSVDLMGFSFASPPDVGHDLSVKLPRGNSLGGS